jgi:HEAT repeat protein
MLAVLACLLLQAEAPRELVERLRSDRLEEREDARRKLKALGAAAVPALQKAASDPDAEVAQRAKDLLAALALLARFTPKLAAALPGLEDRLASGDDRAWTAALLRAVERKDGRLVHPELRGPDLAPLAERAARGAATDEARLIVCETVRHWDLRAAAPALRAYLKDGDPHVRGTAAETLGLLGDRESVPAILRLIDDDADERFFTALEFLKAQAELRALLRHREAAVRGHAVLRLDPADGDDVLALLQDPEPSVRGKAAAALGRAGVKSALPKILAILEQDGSDEVTFALEALAHLKAVEAVPAIEKLLDRKGQIRGEAARVLGILGSKASIPKILPLLRDEDGAVRMRTVTAVVALDAREAVPDLRKLTRDPNSILRQVAAQALGDLRAREGIPELVELLKDGQSRVVFESVRALLELRAAEAVPALQALVDGTKSDARWAAVDAIATLDGRAQLPAIRRWLGDADEDVRAAAVNGLARVAGPDAAPEIAARLKDAGPSVRAASAEALARLDARDFAGRIEPLVADPDDSARRHAARALCVLGSKRGVPVLLEDPEEFVYLNALGQPAAWKRLQARSATGTRDGRNRELAEEVARQAGLAVDWSAHLTPDQVRELAEKRDAASWLWEARMSVHEVFRYLLPDSCDFILEAERIRVVTREEAFAFWRAWEPR